MPCPPGGAVALMGGLSTQWYGCGGYTDHEHLEDNPRAAVAAASEQVGQALWYSTAFVVGTAAFAGVAFAVLRAGRGADAPRFAS